MDVDKSRFFRDIRRVAAGTQPHGKVASSPNPIPVRKSRRASLEGLSSKKDRFFDTISNSISTWINDRSWASKNSAAMFIGKFIDNPNSPEILALVEQNLDSAFAIEVGANSKLDPNSQTVLDLIRDQAFFAFVVDENPHFQFKQTLGKKDFETLKLAYRKDPNNQSLVAKIYREYFAGNSVQTAA